MRITYKITYYTIIPVGFPTFMFFCQKWSLVYTFCSGLNLQIRVDQWVSYLLLCFGSSDILLASKLYFELAFYSDKNKNQPVLNCVLDIYCSLDVAMMGWQMLDICNEKAKTQQYDKFG